MSMNKQHVYLNKLIKSHNSCKTCSIPKSNIYVHPDDMLVTVYGYEQNPPRCVGGVAHTRCWDVRTFGEVQI